MFQAKLVDPSGRPKALVGTHDTIASGKEFEFFKNLVCIMANACEPDPEGRCDIAGRQMVRMLSPDEIVRRAQILVLDTMDAAISNNWAIEAARIDDIYENHDSAARPAGFAPRAAVGDSDDIPF